MTYKTGIFTTEYEREEDTIEVTVEWEGHYEPAKLSGPWEDSYEAEGEIDILSVTDTAGKSVMVSQEFEEHLIDMAWDEFHEQGE